MRFWINIRLQFVVNQIIIFVKIVCIAMCISESVSMERADCKTIYKKRWSSTHKTEVDHRNLNCLLPNWKDIFYEFFSMSSNKNKIIKKSGRSFFIIRENVSHKPLNISDVYINFLISFSNSTLAHNTIFYRYRIFTESYPHPRGLDSAFATLGCARRPLGGM